MFRYISSLGWVARVAGADGVVVWQLRPKKTKPMMIARRTSIFVPIDLLVILARLAHAVSFDLSHDARSPRAQLFGGHAGKQVTQEIGHRGRFGD